MVLGSITLSGCHENLRELAGGFAPAAVTITHITDGRRILEKEKPLSIRPFSMLAVLGTAPGECLVTHQRSVDLVVTGSQVHLEQLCMGSWMIA